MADHNDLGKIGEEKAADYLLEKGFVILEKNWRYQKSEIDLIAQKQNLIIAVEVKTRSSLNFGTPQNFVNTKKINLLSNAFNQYIVSKNIDLNARFDIIAVFFDGKKYNIEHIENAFLCF